MKSFSLLALFVSLAACSMKSNFGPSWNDASVSEKSLQENGCRFTEKKDNEGKTVSDVECDEATDEQSIDKQIAGIDHFIENCNAALAVIRLRPSTSVEITLKKSRATAKRLKLNVRKSELISTTAVQNADNVMKKADEAVKSAEEAAAKARQTISDTMRKTYSARKEKLISSYDVTFNEGTLSYSKELITAAEGNTDGFVKALGEFIAGAQSCLQDGLNISDADRALLTREIESAKAIIQEIEKPAAAAAPETPAAPAVDAPKAP